LEPALLIISESRAIVQATQLQVDFLILLHLQQQEGLVIVLLMVKIQRMNTYKELQLELLDTRVEIMEAMETLQILPEH